MTNTFAQDLVEIRNTLAENLQAKNITVNETDGIRTLTNKIKDIETEKNPTYLLFDLYPIDYQDGVKDPVYDFENKTKSITYYTTTAITDNQSNLLSSKPLILSSDDNRDLFSDNRDMSNSSNPLNFISGGTRAFKYAQTNIGITEEKNINFSLKYDGDEYNRKAIYTFNHKIKSPAFFETAENSNNLEYLSNNNKIKESSNSKYNYALDYDSVNKYYTITSTLNNMSGTLLTEKLSSSRIYAEMEFIITSSSSSWYFGFGAYDDDNKEWIKTGGISRFTAKYGIGISGDSLPSTLTNSPHELNTPYILSLSTTGHNYFTVTLMDEDRNVLSTVQSKNTQLSPSRIGIFALAPNSSFITPLSFKFKNVIVEELV